MGCCGKKLPEGEEGFCSGGLFGGVVDDYRRRFPNYMKDITQGITPKTLSSALFMFFATFFSTASLGALIQKATNKRIGLEEYLLMNAIAGMTHALFGCQVRENIICTRAIAKSRWTFTSDARRGGAPCSRNLRADLSV